MQIEAIQFSSIYHTLYEAEHRNMFMMLYLKNERKYISSKDYTYKESLIMKFYKFYILLRVLHQTQPTLT